MTYTLEPLPQTGTPNDYLRLQFDPINVPPKRIVGLLACQRDPLLQQLTTKLHAGRPAAIAAVPTQKGKGQKKKDKSGASTPANGASGSQTPVNGSGTDTPAAVGRLWEVELDDTVIFPEGGGQPSDTGTLTFIEPNGGEKSFKVEMCVRKKLDSVHLIRVSPEDEDFVGHIEARATVRVDVDWVRRTDQMTIHTAQHLLSAVLDTYNLNTLSWAMHAYPSLECPYVELPRQLTWAEVEEVEAKCNALIDDAKRVWIEVSVQGQEDPDGAKSRGLPKDYDGGVVRHCCIDQTDRNACCGTQLPHIGLCTQIHVIPPTLASDSTKPSKSTTKLYFTAGPRARRYLANSSRQLSAVAQAIACNRDQTAERAGKAEEAKKDLNALSEGLRKELSRYVADAALAGSEGGVVLIHRGEKGTHDFEFLGMVAVRVTSSEIEGRAGKGAKLAICVSGIEGVSGGLLLVQSADDALAKATKEKLAAALDALSSDITAGGKRVKGGGAKGRYMCKVDGKVGRREKEAIEVVVEQLKKEQESV